MEIFTQVGPATGGAVPLDATTGQPIALPKVAGYVIDIAPDGTGGWYVGGTFTHVGGVPRSNIAHILADGTVSAWNPNPEGGTNPGVSALAVSGTTVYAGGYYTRIGGEPQSRIAAISADVTTVSVGDDTAPITRSGLRLVGPNPTAGGLQIEYVVVLGGPVRLDVIDVEGRVVTTLTDRVQPPGRYVTTWDGRDGDRRVPSGIYLLRFSAPDQTAVRKFTTIR